MYEQQIDGLKNYLATLIEQSESGLEAKLDVRIDELQSQIYHLRTEIHDGFASIAEILEQMNNWIDACV